MHASIHACIFHAMGFSVIDLIVYLSRLIIYLAFHFSVGTGLYLYTHIDMCVYAFLGLYGIGSDTFPQIISI